MDCRPHPRFGLRWHPPQLSPSQLFKFVASALEKKAGQLVNQLPRIPSSGLMAQAVVLAHVTQVQFPARGGGSFQHITHNNLFLKIKHVVETFFPPQKTAPQKSNRKLNLGRGSKPKLKLFGIFFWSAGLMGQCWKWGMQNRSPHFWWKSKQEPPAWGR